MTHNSILDLFLDNADRFGDRTAAMVKRSGAYQEITWADMAHEAKAVAAGLVAVGVEAADRVCVISQTRIEWVISDMAILWAGATTVPIYHSNLPDESQYIADDSGAVVVFAEDREQVAKFRAERSRLPKLKKIIQISGPVDANDEWVVSFEGLKALGEAHVAELDNRRAGLSRDSILTIIYTSGTTGRPKGVMTTHDAMLYEAESVVEVDVIRPTDIQLIFLPLAHVFAKVLEIAWLATRHVMAFAEDMTTIKENLSEVRPTLMAGVPRIYEKFHGAVVNKAMAPGGMKAKLFEAAAELSAKNGEAQAAGRKLSPPDRLKFRVLKRLVFSKINAGLGETLGGRMRLMVSGGAPLSRRINWFFRDAGITILEGYGLTETAAGSCINRPGKNRIGSVGTPLPGTDVKIAEDGEILIRGRGVMKGYWNNPEATAEVISDTGWFHTGDIGEIDRSGFLTITDRKKDLIITAGGKNVAPQNIENLLKSHKLISQAVVHGDRRKFLSALITLDEEALRELASERGWGGVSYAELTQKPEVYELIDKAVAGLNKELARYETVKKFRILEQDFSQETGELTPTLKVKRKVISDRYKSLFDGFYDERIAV